MMTAVMTAVMNAAGSDMRRENESKPGAPRVGHKQKDDALCAPRTGHKIRNDMLLIAAILLLVSVAALMLLLTRRAGDTVVVTVNGQPWGEYSLSEDRTVEIRNGDGYNILIIEGGRAYVQQASCPDGICASHRPIEHDGESIICLPNKVVVEIRATSRKQPDIIA